MNSLELFRDGNGYIEIAQIMGLDLIHGRNAEAEVERQIHRLRRIERVQPYLAKRSKREARRAAQRIAAARKAERFAKTAAASLPKPVRVSKTEEQKRADKKAYRIQARDALREIRAGYAS